MMKLRASLSKNLRSLAPMEDRQRHVRPTSLPANIQQGRNDPSQALIEPSSPPFQALASSMEARAFCIPLECQRSNF